MVLRTKVHRLSDENGIISALAFDQHGALKRLMAPTPGSRDKAVAQMEELKVYTHTETAEETDSLHSSIFALQIPQYELPALLKALNRMLALAIKPGKATILLAPRACQRRTIV